MKRITLAFLPLLLLLAACGGADREGSGRAQVLLTDAPVAEADSLPVTFSRIELVGEAGGTVSVEVEPQTTDVLTLRNGGLELLGEVELPAGSYHQLRLIVDTAEITFGEESFDVTVPSGARTGLKINVEPALEVESNQTSQVVLDFDAQRAVVETPAGSGSYNLQPTGIRAVSMEASGTVEGNAVAPGIDDAAVLPSGGVSVTVYDQEGNEVTATVTEDDGSFRLITLPAGTYDLELSLAGYLSLAVPEVAVTEGETTVLGELVLELGAGGEL